MHTLFALSNHFRRLLLVLSATTVLLFSFWLAVGAQSTSLSTAGYLDFSYQGWSGAGAPTGEKPESKLWWNDGFWWGALYNSSAGELRIYRLNWGTQTWEDTTVAIDDRDNTKTDVLWDNTAKKLYIASHIAIDSDGEEVGNADEWARLYRYSYDAASQKYTLDLGFPTTINRDVSETLVLAKGSSGRLWITFVSRGTTSGSAPDYRVFVNSSANDGATWGNAFVPNLSPAITATHVARGDVAAIVAVGDKVGLMWNNSTEKALAHSTLHFAIHAANSTSGAWATQSITVPHGADDHVSLRALQATSSGQVFAAIKTDTPISGTITQTVPLIGMVARDLTDPNGAFIFREYSRNTDKDTRPVLLIDEGALNVANDDKVYIFVTGRESGSKICYKTLAIQLPLSNLGNFPEGDCGTSFIEDATYARINNATATKQNVNKTTGLVVLASDNSTPTSTTVSRVYVHNKMGDPPPVVTARGPLSGATDVLLTGVVTATFSKQINPATINAATFTVKGASGVIAGNFTYDMASRTATFTPAAPLAANTVYTVALTNGIKDTSGQALNEGIDLGPVIEQWHFTTLLPSVAFASATYSANEINSTATITVLLNAPSAQIASVNYATSNGTASAGSDYTATSGTLIFGIGELIKTFTVPIINDAIQDNGTETVNLTLSNPVSATFGLVPTATLFLVDDDVTTVQFGAATATVNENSGTAAIAVTLSRAAAFSITVNYATSNGTALADSDYTAAMGTLTFAPGEVSKTFPVNIVNDNVFEANETLNLVLSNVTPVSATIGVPGNSAVLTIVDDDPQPTVQFSTNTYGVGEAAGSTTIAVTLSSLSSLPVTVNYATSNGTATAGSDYTAATGMLTFAPGESSKTFPMAITADALDEDNEVVGLSLSAPTGATLGTPANATLTITDDDPTPTVQFEKPAFVASEGSDTVLITVTLSVPSGKLVTVNYASSDGSATAGDDYAAVSGTLTFAPGATRQQIELALLEDTLVEASETIDLALSSPNSAALGDQQSATLTILDNEPSGSQLYLPLVMR